MINVELSEEDLKEIAEATEVTVTDEQMGRLKEIKKERTIALSKLIKDRSRNKAFFNAIKELQSGLEDVDDTLTDFDAFDKMDKINALVLENHLDEVSSILDGDIQEVTNFAVGLIPKV